MSTPRQEVIDLTGDAGSPSSRLSGIRQYGRPGFQPHARISRTPPLPPPPIPDVISIDDHDDTPGGHVNAGSPEVELLFTRTLLPTMMPHSRPYGARPPLSGRPASPPPMRSAISYSQSTGGQPSWAEWRNQGQRRHRFDAPLLPEDMYPQRHRRPEGFPRGPHSHTPSHIQTRIIGDLFQNRDSMFMNGVPDIELPGGLNFTAQGFVMNTGNQAAVNARARPPPPTYEPPSPPRAGYTRDPREEDILLCPNCEEELGVGGNDTKKQVWVIKRCGHVCFTLLRYLTELNTNQERGLLRGMYQASAEIRKIKGTATWVAKTLLQVRGRSLRSSICQPFQEFLSGLLVML